MKKIPLVVLGVLFLASLACTSAWEYEAALTAEAGTAFARDATLAAMQTSLAGVGTPIPTLTQTPSCANPQKVGADTVCADFLTKVPEGTTPQSPMIVTITGNKDWIPYYLGGKQMGVVGNGTTWSGTSTQDFVISGWVREVELNMSLGTIYCHNHDWGHKDLCHAHIYSSSGEILGNVFDGVSVEISQESIFLVVEDDTGVKISQPGRIATIKTRASINK